MSHKTLLLAGAAYNLSFAVFHLFFWKIFGWRADLRRLTSVNRAIMQVLNLCLTFCFLIFAYVSAFHSADLLGTQLGKTILASIAVFWFLRAIEQIAFFGLRSKISAVLFVLFLIGTAIYAIPLLSLAG